MIETVVQILAVACIIYAFCYVFFTRQTKNFTTRILKKKRFVVCHMNYSNTKYHDEYIVVPEQDYLTKVGKYSYDLNPKFAALEYNKRLHYVLDEGNAIPRHYAENSNDEIVFQAMEIQTALDNNVMEYLFSKKKEVLIMGLFLVAGVAIVVIIYDIYKIGQLSEQVRAISDYLNQAALDKAAAGK